jgi:[acyl-carrier-protein] S-malonyltransferase
MGKDLYETIPAARAVFDEADDVLGFALSRLCFEGPDSELTLTHNAQPAILTHSVAVHRCIADAIGTVAMSAGHSLGEFSAYVAAGAIDFADGVRTVRRRGELMLKSGEARAGAMAAILGLDDAAIDRACEAASTHDEVCVAANYNAPGQTVISGDVAAVRRAMENAKEAGAKRAIQLNVSGAFHSPLMEVAEAGLADQLASIEFRAPSFPVVSNVTASPVTAVTQSLDLLRRQLTSPVRWTMCVATMREHGVARFIELGPGNVLTGLLRRIDREAEGRSIGTAAEIEGVAA